MHRNFKPLFANQICADIFGYTNPEEITAMDSILEIFWAPEEQERIEGYRIRRMAGDKEVPSIYENRGMRKDGSFFWFENNVTLIDWQGEKAIQAAVIDITDRKQADELLSYQSKHDALTGLINRYEFENRIKGMLQEIGVDYAQGYSIGEPRPFENIIDENIK